MAHNIEDKLRAEELYVGGEDAKEIAASLGVPVKTVFRWIKDNGWDDAKKARLTSGAASLTDLKLIIANEIGKMKASGTIDGKTANILSQLFASAEKLERGQNKRQNILLGSREWIEFLQAEHPDVLDSVKPLMNDFSKWVKRRYPEGA